MAWIGMEDEMTWLNSIFILRTWMAKSIIYWGMSNPFAYGASSQWASVLHEVFKAVWEKDHRIGIIIYIYWQGRNRWGNIEKMSSGFPVLFSFNNLVGRSCGTSALAFSCFSVRVWTHLVQRKCPMCTDRNLIEIMLRLCKEPEGKLFL